MSKGTKKSEDQMSNTVGMNSFTHGEMVLKWRKRNLKSIFFYQAEGLTRPLDRKMLNLGVFFFLNFK